MSLTCLIISAFELNKTKHKHLETQKSLRKELRDHHLAYAKLYQNIFEEIKDVPEDEKIVRDLKSHISHHKHMATMCEKSDVSVKQLLDHSSNIYKD